MIILHESPERIKVRDCSTIDWRVQEHVFTHEEMAKDVRLKEWFEFCFGAAERGLWGCWNLLGAQGKFDELTEILDRAPDISYNDAVFCTHCGASKPKREGEGTCWRCDPEGCLRRWIKLTREQASENTGPADDYSYQRDQGKLDLLDDLEHHLNS